MKNLIICISLFFLLFSSCNDDGGTSCNLSDKEQVFLGTWTETKINGLGGEVTFKSDGTGYCTPESLFKLDLNGTTYLTFNWTIGALGTELNLTYPNNNSLNYIIVVTACNTLEVKESYSIRLNRK